jgi:methylated-DNA-[protein]-cysteine S-methyltransferase
MRIPADTVRCGPGPHPAGPAFERYFEGDLRAFNLPLDLDGCTEFHRRVLEAVLDVPNGETRTYAQIALQIGRPGAYRAVGRANATNPLPIVIPCHRLVGADGSLRGYGAPGGIETKAWLLRFEADRDGGS